MIRADNVSKYYGAKRVLGPVSFEIKDGEAVGLLGLNGAGKTTALRIFACDLRPSSGSVWVGDIDVVASPHEVRKRIGYLPERPPIYEDMCVDEYLEHAGKLRGMSRQEVQKRLPEVLETTKLAGVRTQGIGTLSHGFRQRVGVAQAIVHNPQLLILDEPTRGLDPVQIVEMRRMICNLKDNHTVLVSSHILTEISETCDRLLVLGNGQLLASGTEAELARRSRVATKTSLVVRPKANTNFAQVATLLTSVTGVINVHWKEAVEEGSAEYSLESDTDIRGEVCREVAAAGHDILSLRRFRDGLEDIFLQLVHSSG